MLLKKLSDDRGLRAIITDLHSQHMVSATKFSLSYSPHAVVLLI